MHIDARIDELFGTERSQRSKVSVKSIAGQLGGNTSATWRYRLVPLTRRPIIGAGAGTRCSDRRVVIVGSLLITAALNDNMVKLRLS
jgi:hypothetical protein